MDLIEEQFIYGRLCRLADFADDIAVHLENYSAAKAGIVYRSLQQRIFECEEYQLDNSKSAQIVMRRANYVMGLVYEYIRKIEDLETRRYRRSPITERIDTTFVDRLQRKNVKNQS